MSMQLIDSHCHLDAAEFKDSIEEVMSSSRKAGVTRWIIPGVSPEGWPGLVALCERYKGIYCAPGIHPLFLNDQSTSQLKRLTTLLTHPRVVAIGEIGLDFFMEGADRTNQQKLFEAQLEIAAAANLPVILHVRKAHDQVLATLRRRGFPRGGIVHAFGGSQQQAEQYIKLGFCIGIGGTITSPRATRIRAIAASLPAESLVLETDSPDMVPAGRRGQTNRPEFLRETLATLALLRNEDPQAIALYTTENCKRVLGSGLACCAKDKT